jgi:hypothetical protein
MTDFAEPDVLSPREIVAGLHAEIAALSPEHAELVAEYQALPRRERTRYSPEPRPASIAVREKRRERAGRYVRLRESGLGKKAAARRAGIAVRTASQYELDIRDGKLEVTGG